MKFLKSSWRILLGGAIGFLLGAIVFRIPISKAQNAPGMVRVYAVDSSWQTTNKAVQGSVVGFSCAQSGKYTECYLVTQ